MVWNLFRGKELISLNISGMLIIFLILIGLILSVKIYNEPKDLENVVKIWGIIITPIITLTLGYIYISLEIKTKYKNSAMCLSEKLASFYTLRFLY